MPDLAIHRRLPVGLCTWRLANVNGARVFWLYAIAICVYDRFQNNRDPYMFTIDLESATSEGMLSVYKLNRREGLGVRGMCKTNIGRPIKL